MANQFGGKTRKVDDPAGLLNGTLTPEQIQELLLSPILQGGLQQLVRQGTVSNVDPLSGRPTLAEETGPRYWQGMEAPFAAQGGFLPGRVGSGTLGTPVHRGALRQNAMMSLLANSLAVAEAEKRKRAQRG